MENQVTFSGFIHGGDYNPEQWLEHPEILKKDIEYFKKASINEVSVGIFSWSVLEPEEGRFHFEWMEKIIDDMYQQGISVFLATPSGARPKWLADKYEEVLRVNENRQRNLFGSRHNHCYTSPVYREKVRIINMELAKRFGKHPGVKLWHLSNEYNGECHCPLCQKEFRNWLKKRYGSIEHLNDCWCTTFWSHTYQSFEQIESPSMRGETLLHGLTLDWRRFVTQRTIDFIKWEIQTLRDGGSDKPVTTNLMYDFTGFDCHQLANELDIVSWDCYPEWQKDPEWITASRAGMQHDIMRTLLKKPFLLMESCPSATSWQAVNHLKKPGLLKASSLQAVAHGSDSVQYFQLRQSRGASEKFHGAVIDHYGGDDTRVFQDVSEIGRGLEMIKEISGSGTIAEVAIVHDWQSRWALENSMAPRNENMYYLATVEKIYGALKRYGINIDIVDMSQEIKGYKLVIAPMLYMLRNKFEEKIEEFTREGGVFLTTYWTGIVDEYDRCYLGGTPYGLMKVLGLRSTEIDALFDWEENHIAKSGKIIPELKERYHCKNLCDLVSTSTAEVLMEYGEDFYKGMPAFTVNSYGGGKAYYVCADMDEDFYLDVFGKLINEAQIAQVIKDLPVGVEVNIREQEGIRYVFIQNYQQHSVTLQLPEEEYSIIYGDYKGGELESFGTLILKMNNPNKHESCSLSGF
ncbi:beta-galactosidase [Anaerocolumna xylanovorans]|uniref:Beta-galactosidase n=1 Tax=Anaerocolumna xylanovorans DSM 12503 TaxID=1121345 RepID=A0A1M7Y5H1_9FIRM|nr:beta-galactosidase [Anaerocolumna xylanovorans]SHO47638.1 beta-galactosidase [Anaerocolumna xylanovorans DSM 12503]